MDTGMIKSVALNRSLTVNIHKTELSMTTSCFQWIDMSYNVLIKSLKLLLLLMKAQ